VCVCVEGEFRGASASIYVEVPCHCNHEVI
jgi:hypothetical protein